MVRSTMLYCAVNEHQDLRRKYADECYERKQLYNKVLELKGNASIRGPVEREVDIHLHCADGLLAVVAMI